MKSGDWCPACPIGRLTVFSVRRHGDTHIRYLRCDSCRRTSGKETIPAAAVRRRHCLTKHSTPMTIPGPS